MGFADPNKTTFAVSMDSSSPGVPFLVKEGNGTTATWNGINSQGQLVASGNYTVQLLSTAAGNSTIVASKGFVILDAPDANGTPKVTVGPDPLGPLDTQLVFAFSSLPAGCSAAVRLYNLAGELVAQGVGSAASGKVVMQAGNWAAGVYVADFEVRQGGGMRSRQLIRLAVAR